MIPLYATSSSVELSSIDPGPSSTSTSSLLSLKVAIKARLSGLSSLSLKHKSHRNGPTSPQSPTRNEEDIPSFLGKGTFNTNLKDLQKDFVFKVVHYLQENMSSNRRPPLDNPISIIFLSPVAPSINLLDFTLRLVKYANGFCQDSAGLDSCGVRCLLVSLVYIERGKITLTPMNIYRYLLIAMLEGLKIMEDTPISHRFWGKVGGMSCKDLCDLEIAFCEQLDYRLFASTDDITKKRQFFANLLDIPKDY
jgi:hypothetical protein